MPQLMIVHRPSSASSPLASKPAVPDSFIKWETCRRQIFFSEEPAAKFFASEQTVNSTVSKTLDWKLDSDDEVFVGVAAEAFLIEVLCGLRSPLLGETEVFGQFKLWWQNLPSQEFKTKYSSRIQKIYSVVKKIREESLCGLGSQSYGSLLRRKMKDSDAVDFVGAGQLVEEMVPWIQKKSTFRIWCRDTKKVSKTQFGMLALEILSLNDSQQVANVVVVAAPMEHGVLTEWLQARGVNENTKIFDFRANSQSFIWNEKIKEHLHLDHFVTEVEGHREEILHQVAHARNTIDLWQQEAKCRAQVRPFGWDDL